MSATSNIQSQHKPNSPIHNKDKTNEYIGIIIDGDKFYGTALEILEKLRFSQQHWDGIPMKNEDYYQVMRERYCSLSGEMIEQTGIFENDLKHLLDKMNEMGFIKYIVK